MKVKKSVILEYFKKFIGIIINANILTLIAMIVIPIALKLFGVHYENWWSFNSWFSVQVIVLGILSVTFDPGRGQLAEQMNYRFRNSSLILAYLVIMLLIIF